MTRELAPSELTQRRALVVSACPEEVAYFQESARSVAFDLRLELADDEQTALGLLSQTTSGWLPPDLILLNAREPLQTQECIRRIRQETRCKRTPKVVLMPAGFSGSLTGFYLAGANCCVTKPPSETELPQILRGIFQFWLNCAVLPNPMQVTR